MGNINVDFTPKDISFKKMEKALNYILSRGEYKYTNLKLLNEIGLGKQYRSIVDNIISKETIRIAKNHKTLKNYLSPVKEKSYFIKWVNILLDITEEDYNCCPNYNQKIEYLRKLSFTKAFLQKNIKKNIIENKSNIILFKYGIPKYLREFFWLIIIAEKYANKKYFDYNEEQKEYNSFLNNLENNNTNVQIKKDLSRTFSDINEQNDRNMKMLNNLLIYASSLTKDGYCQGMNFIIGFILKVTNFNEIKSYYIIKYIFPEIKGHFEVGFPLLKKNINLFYKFFSKLYPKLSLHFAKNDVFAQFWVGRWFQTLFTLSLPFDELCYIWDLFLIKGFDFSIYINLAIINHLEKYLMKLEDSSDILSYIKNVLNPEPNDCVNIKDINEINKNIIPLNKIFFKALDLENEINKDKYFQEILSQSKSEDCDSIYSKLTKETDTALSNKKLYLDSSRFSTISTKRSNFEKIILPNNNNNKNNLNIIEKNLFNKNNLISNGKNNNKIIKNKYNINNFATFDGNKKVFHLFDNVDLTKRKSDGLIVNSCTYYNLGNYYNINIPNTTQNYIYYNNPLVINHERANTNNIMFSSALIGYI